MMTPRPMRAAPRATRFTILHGQLAGRADRRSAPAIKARLDKFCVKVMPCQTPTMYMKALRGFEPGPQKPIARDPATQGKPANLIMAFSIHECDAALQYGIIAMTGKSVALIPRVEALHRRRMANRFVEWEGGRVRQAESKTWRGNPKTAEQHRFYGFNIGFEHLYTIGRPSLERVPYGLCIEGGTARTRSVPGRAISHVGSGSYLAARRAIRGRKSRRHTGGKVMSRTSKVCGPAGKLRAMTRIWFIRPQSEPG